MIFYQVFTNCFDCIQRVEVTLSDYDMTSLLNSDDNDINQEHEQIGNRSVV